jgi:hypothetical protein
MERSSHDTAEFVGDLCGELRKLTRNAALDTLTYLLDIAVLEAERLAEPEAQAKVQAKTAA